MSKEIIYRQQHIKTCAAMNAVRNGSWDSPWFLTGETIWGDKRGGHTGNTYRWFICNCNDPKCTARQLVRGSWLEKLAYLGARSKNL